MTEQVKIIATSDGFVTKEIFDVPDDYVEKDIKVKVVFSVPTRPYGLYTDIKAVFGDNVMFELQNLLEQTARAKFEGYEHVTAEVVLTD